MLGLLYLLMCFMVGFTFISLLMPGLLTTMKKSFSGEDIKLPSLLVAFPASMIFGMLFMSWPTYFFAYLLRNSSNPIGIAKRERIIEYVIAGIQEAIKDLEKVEVGTGTEKIENLNTFGPKNSTELISTISSVVAVSKIIAPVLLITALIIIFIWIFYGGL